MIQINDVVVLTEDFIKDGVVAGQAGAVILLHGDPVNAYEVEFVDEQGQTQATIVVRPWQIHKP